jgi:hypothetical protein
MQINALNLVKAIKATIQVVLSTKTLQQNTLRKIKKKIINKKERENVSNVEFKGDIRIIQNVEP